MQIVTEDSLYGRWEGGARAGSGVGSRILVCLALHLELRVLLVPNGRMARALDGVHLRCPWMVTPGPARARLAVAVGRRLPGTSRFSGRCVFFFFGFCVFGALQLLDDVPFLCCAGWVVDAFFLIG